MGTVMPYYAVIGYILNDFPLSLNDVIMLEWIRCYSNTQTISQCNFELYTPLSSCDQEVVAGLQCEGNYVKHYQYC